MKKFLSEPEVRGFFYLWSQGTVAPVAIVFTEFFFFNFFSNCSKLPTSLKDTRNGKKQQKSSKCVCLPWLESISLFSPGWPWTPASASWAPWTATWCILPTLALHGKFHLCVSVTEALCYWDPQTVAEGASASYPGNLLFFPSPWYQHLLLLRMSFCFFLVLRSEVGTGEEGCSWWHFCYIVGIYSGVLLCWAWMCEWKAALWRWGTTPWPSPHHCPVLLLTLSSWGGCF